MTLIGCDLVTRSRPLPACSARRYPGSRGSMVWRRRIRSEPPPGEPTHNNHAVRVDKTKGRHGEYVVQIAIDLPRDLLAYMQAYDGAKISEEHWKEYAKNLECEVNGLKATSWGMFQIMGENYARCGSENLKDFVAAMCRNEVEQLKLLAGFINNKPPLLKAVRAKDWAKIAYYYNGENYRINKYDEKLQKAYARLESLGR